jgi:hypothetical protein
MHVTKTFLYLSNIPWTDDLKNLAVYAYGHHEKLNGTGYPRHLTGDDIPIQMRLITIADMFDALTASDRPYKPAVTADQALDFLRSQGESGLVDLDLVKLMAESRSYESSRRTGPSRRSKDCAALRSAILFWRMTRRNLLAVAAIVLLSRPGFGQAKVVSVPAEPSLLNLTDVLVTRLDARRSARAENEFRTYRASSVARIRAIGDTGGRPAPN